MINKPCFIESWRKAMQSTWKEKEPRCFKTIIFFPSKIGDNDGYSLFFFPLKHDDKHESFIVCYNCSDTYISVWSFQPQLSQYFFFLQCCPSCLFFSSSSPIRLLYRIILFRNFQLKHYFFFFFKSKSFTCCYNSNDQSTLYLFLYLSRHLLYLLRLHIFIIRFCFPMHCSYRCWHAGSAHARACVCACAWPDTCLCRALFSLPRSLVRKGRKNCALLAQCFSLVFWFIDEKARALFGSWFFLFCMDFWMWWNKD